jgi:quinol monooxygenase YgiN
MIIVAGHIRVPADKAEQLKPAAEAVIAATRKEKGCILYSFAWDLSEPGVMRIFEKWESRAALDAHGRQPHMDPWRAAVAKAGVTERDLRTFETDDGDPL